jgi:ketosteroid isomerase-like protein
MATNKEIVEGVYASFSTGDVPAVLGAMAPNMEWINAEGFPLLDGPVIGPQAILDEEFMHLGDIGDEFMVFPRTIVAEGNTVMMDGTYRWKHKVSGEPAEVKCAHVWTLTDGKLTAFQQHVDTVRVRELLD